MSYSKATLANALTYYTNKDIDYFGDVKYIPSNITKKDMIDYAVKQGWSVADIIAEYEQAETTGRRQHKISVFENFMTKHIQSKCPTKYKHTFGYEMEKRTKDLPINALNLYIEGMLDEFGSTFTQAEKMLKKKKIVLVIVEDAK